MGKIKRQTSNKTKVDYTKSEKSSQSQKQTYNLILIEILKWTDSHQAFRCDLLSFANSDNLLLTNN